MKEGLCICLGALALVGCASVDQRGGDRWTEAQTREAIALIKQECGLREDSFAYSGRTVIIDYSRKESDEKVDCAAERAKLYGLFFHNPNSLFGEPFRFLVEGQQDRLLVVEQEAKAEGWVVVKTFAAPDGSTLLILETSPKHTEKQVRHFLDRFRFGDLGDLAVGLAPRRWEVPPPVRD